MLGNADVIAVLPTTDLARAKAFYIDKLGLSRVPLPAEIETGVVLLRSGNSQLLVYERGTPTRPEHTGAAWMVKDFDAVIDGLIARGVTFETYPTMPGTTWDARGVATADDGMVSVWFMDPDGNILSVNQWIDLG